MYQPLSKCNPSISAINLHVAVLIIKIATWKYCYHKIFLIVFLSVIDLADSVDKVSTTECGKILTSSLPYDVHIYDAQWW